jgi:hypothetical protein
MKKFTNVSLLSTFFAIGGVATALVTAAPAQALQGNLSWSDGTNDFFSDVNPDVANDTFTVNLSPNPDNVTLINSATGDFVPPFTAVPPSAPYAEDLTTQALGNFSFVQLGGGGNRFFYESTTPLSFNFNNGANVTWPTGTIVAGEFDDVSGSVQFQLSNPGDEVPNNTLPEITVNGISLLPAATDVLQFGDSVDPSGGSYNAIVDVVPEPTTILGSLVVLGMGAKLKRKKAP